MFHVTLPFLVVFTAIHGFCDNLICTLDYYEGLSKTHHDSPKNRYWFDFGDDDGKIKSVEQSIGPFLIHMTRREDLHIHIKEGEKVRVNESVENKDFRNLYSRSLLAKSRAGLKLSCVSRSNVAVIVATP